MVNAYDVIVAFIVEDKRGVNLFNNRGVNILPLTIVIKLLIVNRTQVYLCLQKKLMSLFNVIKLL
jgi:hypothetical protein